MKFAQPSRYAGFIAALENLAARIALPSAPTCTPGRDSTSPGVVICWGVGDGLPDGRLTRLRVPAKGTSLRRIVHD